MEWRGCVCRIRDCVFELLSTEDDLIQQDEDTWELMASELRLKSTFLYCDLNQLISNTRDEHKKVLTDLANRLFHSMEEVDPASFSLGQTLNFLHINCIFFFLS
ncbi:Oxygen evolving enhancer protein 3 (PsbQ) [Musa troglodytarum]|uniref:Oxygen evolving enhancer protein 3 (PsbQ) n=1 Tax=Musa troglodytarum TaxID=320322 RepID=A0A9E7I2Y7_9LILI|nr:Oxygen evolving enhancer protein 3 (PsbQ) [Musa troglodytarum]